MKNKFLIVLIVLFSSCTEGVVRKETGNYYLGSKVIEMEYEGCEYIQISSGVSHKGNCRNPIHNKDKADK